MNKIKEPIVYLDKIAREKGVTLNERGVNKRSFAYDVFWFEYGVNGSLLWLKIYEDGALRERHVVSPDRIVEIWDNINSRKKSGYDGFRKKVRKIDPGLFGP